ncbi:hypothetical protein DFR74_10316 [Nocardia puris]|uniref:Uncharacterized protein n=1 Tax=Nocardia puris TaxID=208602 RepID=A0A366DSY8_9NOCA|nr:hypothetical protein DFR74_10316 [Nocardia puris]
MLALRRQLHERAHAAGSLMLPAFGYDYVTGFSLRLLPDCRAVRGSGRSTSAVS